MQLVARQGILTQALVVPLSVTLDGKAGIFKSKQLANINKCKNPFAKLSRGTQHARWNKSYSSKMIVRGCLITAMTQSH